MWTQSELWLLGQIDEGFTSISQQRVCRSTGYAKVLVTLSVGTLCCDGLMNHLGFIPAPQYG